MVSEKWGSSFPASPGFGIGSEEDEEEEEADHMFTFRMGKRMQLAVTMDNKAKVSLVNDDVPCNRLRYSPSPESSTPVSMLTDLLHLQSYLPQLSTCW